MREHAREIGAVVHPHAVAREKRSLAQSFLSLRDLSKRYPNGTLAVDGASVDVHEGELVSFLGPSGCGKTTLLRLIAGFETPTRGEIWLSGRRLDTLPPNRRGTTMVFQGYALFPHLNVFENVAYGLRVRHLGGAMLRDRVVRALELVGLSGLEGVAPSQLSGGQQQRVALARALVLEPSLLLFDEPLSNLDAKLREQMRLEIRALQQRLGITAVYVTHDQAEAMTLSDRIAIMRAGRIEQVASPRDVYEAPATRFVADFIGRAAFVPARALAAAGGLIDVELFGYRVRVKAAESISAGAPVDVLVRPEALTLSAEGDGARGVVTQATFLAGSAQYVVQIQGLPFVAIETSPPGHRLLTEGSEVRVRLREDLLRALPIG